MGQAHQCCGVTPVLDLQGHYVYKQTITKAAQILLLSKRPHTITRMNDSINMDSTITESMSVHS